MKRIIIVALFLLLSLHFPLNRATEARVCADSTILVGPASHQDQHLTCEAAAAALSLMHNYNMELPPRLEIEIVDEINGSHDISRFGQFDPFVGKITVVSWKACKEAGMAWRPFGQPMDRALYRSFITHEVAHAVADWNFKIADPAFVAHEYLAYVIQLISMPDDLRASILQAIDIPAFQHTDEITETYYSLNPDYFAVKSFRHFMQAKDQTALIRRLLAGKLFR
jgi:hypothetical protein